MRQNDVERLAAAAHATVAAHGTVLELNRTLETLARVLREVDPHGVYKTTAPATGEDSPDVSLRDSPRLSKLIGGLDSLTHD